MNTSVTFLCVMATVATAAVGGCFMPSTVCHVNGDHATNCEHAVEVAHLDVRAGKAVP